MVDLYRPPDESVESIETLLLQHFPGGIQNLETLTGGQISQTLAFEAEGKGFVLKFNVDKMDANFEKEAFIARQFASPLVPIPAVIENGRHGELHFVIVERAPGMPVADLDETELEDTLPALFETLAAIHSTDVSGFEGHGLFDGEGRGLFSSWRASIEFVMEEERADGFYGKWHSLFDETFLERDVYERVFAEVVRLGDDCPEERWLLHSGYGFGNVLVEGGRVTAVIDWLDARYGDFVYDIAWLEFWSPDRGFAERIRVDYEGRGFDLTAFPSRLLCYNCAIGLDAMRFFAKTDQKSAYEFARDRIFGLLDQT